MVRNIMNENIGMHNMLKNGGNQCRISFNLKSFKINTLLFWFVRYALTKRNYGIIKMLINFDQHSMYIQFTTCKNDHLT